MNLSASLVTKTSGLLIVSRFILFSILQLIIIGDALVRNDGHLRDIFTALN
jgi:hypothetical protein